MGKADFLISKEEGVHKELGKLVGRWKGIMQTMFEPGQVAYEAEVAGSIKLILGGRFALHEYTSTYEGDVLEGLAIYGYHIDRKRYESAWVESFGMGTGIMFSEGNESAKEFSFTGGYGSEAPESKWLWKTTLTFPEPNSLLILAENFSPTGEPSGGVKIQYQKIG